MAKFVVFEGDGEVIVTTKKNEKKTLDDFQVWDREAARVFLEKGALPDGWIDERVSGKLMEIHRTYEEIISLLIREGTIIDLW